MGTAVFHYSLIYKKQSVAWIWPLGHSMLAPSVTGCVGIFECMQGDKFLVCATSRRQSHRYEHHIPVRMFPQEWTLLWAYLFIWSVVKYCVSRTWHNCCVWHSCQAQALVNVPLVAVIVPLVGRMRLAAQNILWDRGFILPAAGWATVLLSILWEIPLQRSPALDEVTLPPGAPPAWPPGTSLCLHCHPTPACQPCFLPFAFLSFHPRCWSHEHFPQMACMGLPISHLLPRSTACNSASHFFESCRLQLWLRKLGSDYLIEWQIVPLWWEAQKMQSMQVHYLFWMWICHLL